MIYPFEADIVLFVRSLVLGLQPYAKANEVSLCFYTPLLQFEVLYQPFELSQSLTHTICDIINLLPPKEQISVRLLIDDDCKRIKIEIENTGINLTRLKELCIKNQYAFAGLALPNGTIYSLSLETQYKAANPGKYQTVIATADNLPRFYSEIQKRLRSCFTQSEKLIAALSLNRPQEAVFIQRINSIITVNLEDESFNTAALCKAMSMTRTQLFRRLTSLLKQAPAGYIRAVRLAKAKALLETTDLTVSEVASKTGFRTLSHFSRIFQQKYGIQPSHFRRNNKTATKE